MRNPPSVLAEWVDGVCEERFVLLILGDVVSGYFISTAPTHNVIGYAVLNSSPWISRLPSSSVAGVRG